MYGMGRLLQKSISLFELVELYMTDWPLVHFAEHPAIRALFDGVTLDAEECRSVGSKLDCEVDQQGGGEIIFAGRPGILDAPGDACRWNRYEVLRTNVV